MLKLVIYLDDSVQARLEKLSRLMARDPNKQAYIILDNELKRLANIEEENERSNQNPAPQSL
jgi:hypothetical protein